MFISRGRTVKLVDAYRENLLEVVSECLRRYPYARIVYRSTSGLELQIEVGDGRIEACSLVDERGNVYYGDECMDKVVEKGIVESREGAIEVIELSEELVELDLGFAPYARVSRDKGLEILRLATVRRDDRVGSGSGKDAGLDEVLSGVKVVEESVDVSTLMTCLKCLRNVEHRFPKGRSCFELIAETIKRVKGRWSVVYIVCRDGGRVDALLRGDVLSVELTLGSDRYVGSQALEKAKEIESRRLSVYYCSASPRHD